MNEELFTVSDVTTINSPMNDTFTVNANEENPSIPCCCCCASAVVEETIK